MVMLTNTKGKRERESGRAPADFNKREEENWTRLPFIRPSGQTKVLLLSLAAHKKGVNSIPFSLNRQYLVGWARFEQLLFSHAGSGLGVS